VTDDPLAEQLETLKELRAIGSPEWGPAFDDWLTQMLRAYLYNKNRAAALTLRCDRLEKALLERGHVTLADLKPAETFAPLETPTKRDNL